jgi:hypothetical protein
LLHLLGLKAPEESLTGLDGVLIGLRTRELIQQLLEARCRLSPVVMMIEDLHSVDSASQELLGRIVESEASLRLLLVTTRRPEYIPPWLDRAAVAKLRLEPTASIRSMKHPPTSLRLLHFSTKIRLALRMVRSRISLSPMRLFWR